MNNDWRRYIEENNESCYIRLCECRNSITDIIEMSNACHMYNPDKTAEECFIYIVEWVTELNNQLELLDKIDENWDSYLRRVS